MTEEEKKYIEFIETICKIVNKNKRLGVSFKSLEYYGLDGYWEDKK